MEPDRKTLKLAKLNRRDFGSAAAFSALAAFGGGALPVRAESPDDSSCVSGIGRGTAPGPMTLCRSGENFRQANSSAEPTARSPATRPATCM